MSLKYEARICGEWHTVDATMFRSWTGPRCLDGKVYHGRRHVLGRDELVAGAMIDLCCDCGFEEIMHFDPDPDHDIVCPACYADRHG